MARKSKAAVVEITPAVHAQELPLLAATPLDLEYGEIMATSIRLPEYGTGPDQALVDNIEKNGILEPLIVRRDTTNGTTTYRLLEGRRRLLSALRLSLDTVPVLMVTGDINDDAIKLAVHGLRRSNPVMEVQAIAGLLKHGHSESDIARATGMTVATVRERQLYLRLIPELLEAFYTGSLRASIVKACSALSIGQQNRALEIFDKTGKLTAQDIKDLKVASAVNTDPLEGFDLPDDSGAPARMPAQAVATILDLVARLERGPEFDEPTDGAEIRALEGEIRAATEILTKLIEDYAD